MGAEIWTVEDARVLAGDLTALKGGGKHGVDHLGVAQGPRLSVPIVPGPRIDAGRPDSPKRRWMGVGFMLGAGVALLCAAGARMAFDVVRCFV